MLKVRPICVAALVAMMWPAITDASDATTATGVPETAAIPAGAFISGSDREEREAAYRLDEAAYGHSITRKRGWYEDEDNKGPQTTGAYHITRTPITNRQYARFIAATGHPAPDVGRATWRGYGLIHPYGRTRKFAWVAGRPPPGREDHPVVLVSHDDAKAYAGWLTARTGSRWRLPTEFEWEKAARGTDGRRFPWGDKFDPSRLNSHDQGPFETTAVASFMTGASPFGVLDAAGQVFEWTATPWPPGARAGTGRKAGPGARFTVKGGSWDDKGCGICRAAAHHGRPRALKHILIGFRLVREEVREATP